MSVKETWQDLKTWHSEHLPDVIETLNPGASEQALNDFNEELRRELGQGLPAELRELYAQNDGQNQDAVCGVWFGLLSMTLEEVRRDWQDWVEIAEETADDSDFIDDITVHPPETIQRVYANPYWLPFVHDGGGNHIGIDLQPGPKGTAGQIINFGPDKDNRYVLARSLNEFIGWLLTQYQAGNYSIVPYDVDEEQGLFIQPLNPPLEHFLDAVPALFDNKGDGGKRKGQLSS